MESVRTSRLTGSRQVDLPVEMRDELKVEKLAGACQRVQKGLIMDIVADDVENHRAGGQLGSR